MMLPWLLYLYYLNVHPLIYFFKIITPLFLLNMIILVSFLCILINRLYLYVFDQLKSLNLTPHNLISNWLKKMTNTYLMLWKRDVSTGNSVLMSALPENIPSKYTQRRCTSIQTSNNALMRFNFSSQVRASSSNTYKMAHNEQFLNKLVQIILEMDLYNLFEYS